MRVGILGYGEIGKAIYNLYSETSSLSGDLVLGVRDLDTNYFQKDMDVMHVCIPYSNRDDFIGVVTNNQLEYKPKLTIIHSTVAVGTTKYVHQPTVHAPVRGMHPDLTESIRTFVMYIGYDSTPAMKKALKVLTELEVTVKPVRDSRHTELAKLASTTNYGIQISYHAYINRLSDSLGLNFDDVMTNWNETYNEGYKELGRENVTRPILYPPKDDKIRGHCVLPNTKLLESQFGEDEILSAILRHE